MPELNPEVFWSQCTSAIDGFQNVIYLSVKTSGIIDESTLEYNLTPNHISVKFVAECNSGGGHKNTFAFELDFFATIKTEKTTKLVFRSSLDLFFLKEKKMRHHWPRLSIAQDDPSYVTTDHSKWVHLDKGDGGQAQLTPPEVVRESGPTREPGEIDRDSGEATGNGGMVDPTMIETGVGSSASDRSPQDVETRTEAAARLYDYGDLRLQKYRWLGHSEDFDRAVSSLVHATEWTSDQDDRKVSYLGKLGSAYLLRFERARDCEDLDRSIHCYGNAARIASIDHPQRSDIFERLGFAYFKRYDITEQIIDIDHAISNQECAVRIMEDNHPKQHQFLANLSNSYMRRFKRTKDTSDIRNALPHLERAAQIIPKTDPDRPKLLVVLGKVFSESFEAFDDLGDLAKSITYHEQAVAITPDEDVDDLCIRIIYVGRSYLRRFERLGLREDVEMALVVTSAVLDSMEEGDSDVIRSSALFCIGCCFLRRFELSGLNDLGDLAQAISNVESAQRITSDDDRSKPRQLMNLGLSLCRRFERLGNHADIDMAVSHLERAVRIAILHDHPDTPSCLSNLGMALHTRFEHSGDLSDIEAAISAHEDVLRRTPATHRDRPNRANNFGKALLQRGWRLGDIKDVDKSILLLEEAIRHTKNDHPGKVEYLSTLGNAFAQRFHLLEDVEDLENAISNLRDAVHSTSENHVYLPSRLNNLGGLLSSRFAHLAEHPVTDLEESIATHDRVTRITPNTHMKKPLYLYNFAVSLHRRYDLQRNVADLEKAIHIFDDGIRVMSKDDPVLPHYLYGLGDLYHSRFGWSGDLKDVEKSILHLEQARDVVSDDDPLKPQIFDRIGDTFVSRWKRTEHPDDIRQAILAYSSAARSPVGQASLRFIAAAAWSVHSYECNDASVPPINEALAIALDLVPQLAWLGRTIDSRYEKLTGIASTMSRNAAAVALAADDPRKALQWLEQGRSIVWGQTLKLRTPLDQLRTKNRDLADRLALVSRQLETGSVPTTLAVSEGVSNQELSIEHLKIRQHQLADEWDDLVQRVRGIDGFEQFLQPKQYTELQQSARAGIVVVLNSTKFRCDALIVSSEPQPLRHIQLNQLTYERAEHLQIMAQKTLSGLGLRKRDDERYGRPKYVGNKPRKDDEVFTSLLAELWTSIVKPVIDCLDLKRLPSDELPRIWWCPTGPLAFLPIHAAGLYDLREPVSLADYAISSYTPTLSALLTALDRRSDKGLEILAVAQPETPNARPLPGTVREINIIRSKAEIAGVPIRVLEGRDGTVLSVLTAMEECSWVHLACHGIQDPLHPTNSGLLLADGSRLNLSEIITKRLPHADFAFLSACQTATGDDARPEEAIHLAAGLLMAGYRSIIATMWSIGDADAPVVADDVYSRLFCSGNQPDSSKAARALHAATQRLRAKYDNRSFVRWVPFIHVGV